MITVPFACDTAAVTSELITLLPTLNVVSTEPFGLRRRSREFKPT